MGRGASFYCSTCKHEYYLGYGSYGTWLDHCRSVEEYDKFAAAAPDSATLAKNINVRRCLEEHAGHDFCCQSSDWTHAHHGKLCGEFGFMGACVTLIEDYAQWGHTDLTVPSMSPPETTTPDTDTETESGPRSQTPPCRAAASAPSSPHSTQPL